ncbi:hypothetical protein BD410DRAFT_611881 [Rickenella mellea]|uniref:Uncharacterized protein n=1 Tax=Rickenella mellea TaxID=50990 RepID=A0A4Y7PMX2_9AGAM|nr:hypothetical protein BD410DRAFT_611881 [Rickenella mellea]
MFSKRAEHILQKATSSSSSSRPHHSTSNAPNAHALSAGDMKRAGSLDGASALARRSPRTSEDLVISRPATPNARSSRRISFVSGIPRSWTGTGGPGPAPTPNPSGKPSTTTSLPSSKSGSGSAPTFTTLLTSLTAFTPILSTSPLSSVHIPLPRLIVSLAEKEVKEPGRKVSGEEKAGLGSLLGWGDVSGGGGGGGRDGREGRDGRGKEGRGRGMYGLDAFARHQGLTVLYAEYGPAPAPASLPASPPKVEDASKTLQPQTVPDVVIAAVADAAAKEVDHAHGPDTLVPPPGPSLPQPSTSTSTSTPSTGPSLSQPLPQHPSSSSPSPSPRPIPIPSPIPSPLSLLHPPPAQPPSRASSTDVSKKPQASEASISTATSTPPKTKMLLKKGGGGGGVLCERGRWVSYRYYSRGQLGSGSSHRNETGNEKSDVSGSGKAGAKHDTYSNSKEKDRDRDKDREGHTASPEKEGGTTSTSTSTSVPTVGAASRDRDADAHHPTSTSTSTSTSNPNSNVVHDDPPLGTFIERSCSADVDSEAMEACKRPGCEARRWEHERVWIHGDVRVAARVVGAVEKTTEEEGDKEKEKDGGGEGKSGGNDETVRDKGKDKAGKEKGDVIMVWESCAVCGETTGRKEMSDGA